MLLGLLQGTLRDYHRDPFPHSLLRTRDSLMTSLYAWQRPCDEGFRHAALHRHHGQTVPKATMRDGTGFCSVEPQDCSQVLVMHALSSSLSIAVCANAGHIANVSCCIANSLEVAEHLNWRSLDMHCLFVCHPLRRDVP